MGLKQFLDEERGVSVVLGALLIMGLITAVFPVFYRDYVESKMRELEINHMEEVETQFREMQDKISWMKEGDSGTIRTPAGPGTISFFPVTSPQGKLQISRGSEFENKVVGGNGGVQENYYYYVGDDNRDFWSVGYSSGNSEADNKNDNLYLRAEKKSENTWVTENPVDLSEVDNLWIEWQNTGDSSNNDSYFIVSENKMKDHTNYYEGFRIHNDGKFHENNHLDVSTLENDFYLRIHAVAGPGKESILSTYRVWGEKEISGSKIFRVTAQPGRVEFFGRNIFFVDQTFVYEGGQVILSQSGEEILKSSSLMFNENNDGIRIEYPRIKISGGSDTKSISVGESLSLEYENVVSTNWKTDDFKIVVETEYPTAWERYFGEEGKRIEKNFSNIKSVEWEDNSLLIRTKEIENFFLKEKIIHIR